MASDLRPLQNMLLIAGGTVVGQAVLVLATPLITRLYSPEEIGLYAVFSAIVAMVATIASLHYELAIPLPRSAFAAKRVFVVAMVATALLASAAILIVLLWGDWILQVLAAEKLSNALWLLPICIGLSGVLNVLNLWAIRIRTFRATSLSKGLQGIGQAGPQVGMGFAGAGLSGLLAGQVAGLAIAAVPFMIQSHPTAGKRSPSIRLKSLWRSARLYRRFPLITTWSSFANALGANLPIMMLSALFGPAVTGQFAISYRLLQIPSRLVGQSVSQVFFSAAAQAHREERLLDVTSAVFRMLVTFGLPSFIAIACVAPKLFLVILGDQWTDAAIYAQLVMPWIFMSFLASVLSVLVSVLQKQAEEFVFQLAYVGCALVSQVIGWALSSPFWMAGTLGVLGGVLLGVKTGWLLRIVGMPLNTAARICARECLISLPFAAMFLAIAAYIENSVAAVVATGLLLGVIHVWNFSYRRAYNFGPASP